MSGLIDSIQRRTATSSEQVRVLEITDEDADDVLDALSSDTRRETLRVLFENPSRTSELADRLDTSVQNTHHHLSHLTESGLVEPVDTVYSEKGNEMTVYGPASDPLVFVGDEERFPQVERSLADVVTGLGLLALASLFVQLGTEYLLRPNGAPAADIGPASYLPTSGVTEPLTWLLLDVVEPGFVFFAGCLLVATLVVLLFER